MMRMEARIGKKHPAMPLWESRDSSVASAPICVEAEFSFIVIQRLFHVGNGYLGYCSEKYLHCFSSILHANARFKRSEPTRKTIDRIAIRRATYHLCNSDKFDLWYRVLQVAE